jgi:hypothetical protein
MRTLQWITCGDDGHWCSFDSLILSRLPADLLGVYIIWHTGNPSRVVRVGQGYVADRVAEHRGDKEITQYRAYGSLRITWAAVPKASDRDGFERYLADMWSPLVGDAWPDVDPIAVNSPW